MNKSDAYAGCLLGCAVGDSLGLPTEGLSRKRTAKMLKKPLRHRLVGPYGMCSDDTEHLFFTAQALLRSEGDPDRFVRSLARSLRGWFLAIPAGVGLATARACIKLCCGVPPTKSGVNSAGNGPAMRAPILGVYAAGQPERQRLLVDASTLLTHTDPDAVVGARLVAALADALSSGCDPESAIKHLQDLPDLPPSWASQITRLKEALSRRDSISGVAEQLGLSAGISGYICHTVPMVIYTVLRHPLDPVQGLKELIQCGGDTDTTAAIAGALYGSGLGPDAFPDAVTQTIRNGPLSISVLDRAAQALAREELQPVSWGWPEWH